MHELYELKEKLMDELKEHGSKELSAGSLEIVDKLAHATKNLCKVIEACEEEEGHSSRYYPMDMAYEGNGSMRGGTYRGSYRGGSYRRRDSMGRYSREGGYSRDMNMANELRGLMQDAPDERTRQELQRLIAKVEDM
jgi:hypothetical protein